MTDKILSVDKAIQEAKKLKQLGKHIVLAGGCFDILHKGHVSYLENAKKEGDALFVLLESDESIVTLKGNNRPIHSQKDRAYILSHLQCVDAVVLLPGVLTDSDYDKLIFSLKPDIIASTKGDPHMTHKKRQAERIHARVIEVIDVVENTSTSRLAELLSHQL